MFTLPLTLLNSSQFCPLELWKTTKKLNPQKEGALIAFTYPQSISDKLAESSVSYQPDGGGHQVLRDTAFVWRREDGTNALVQTWPGAFNEKFRQTFHISERTNPDSKKFHPQAVSEFQESMVRLFGPSAAKYPIFFCQTKTVNSLPAVVGISEQVLAHLKENPELMRTLSIRSIDSEGLGFMSDVVDGNGNRLEKHFMLTPGERHVVYRKHGWATMGCSKLLHQFLREAEFHGPPTVECPSGVNESVTTVKRPSGVCESLTTDTVKIGVNESITTDTVKNNTAEQAESTGARRCFCMRWCW